MNRRDFIKKTAIGTAAAGTAIPLVAIPSPRPDLSKIPFEELKTLNCIAYHYLSHETKMLNNLGVENPQEVLDFFYKQSRGNPELYVGKLLTPAEIKQCEYMDAVLDGQEWWERPVKY